VNVPHVPARVPREVAIQRAARRGPWFLRMLRRRDAAPRVECVWLTLYLVPFSVTSSKGPGTMTVSVEGQSGAFAIFEMHSEVQTGRVEGEVFEPRMPEREAIELGRQELLHAILRQSSRGAKPVVGDAGTVSRLCYPFWVYYYERRHGLLDIVMLDAVTGLPAGTKIKAGLLEAFKRLPRINADELG
jgi:hypothetical protein